MVFLLASTSVRDVVGFADFETDVSFDAVKLLVFVVCFIAVVDQEFLVLDLGSNPVLVLFDAIVSFDGEIAGLSASVESGSDLVRVLNALSLGEDSECDNGSCC